MDTKKHVLQQYLERVAIFIDYHNLEASLRNEGIQVDLLALRDYLSEGRWLQETLVYVGSNPNYHNGDQNSHRFLRANGFLIRTKSAKVKPDGSLKCDFDIELTLDVIDHVSRVKPDIVLLVSGDGDFAALATWLRLRGVRVEIAAVPSTLSQDLREAANDYIDLREALQQIHRTEEEFSVQREEVMENGNDDYQRQAGSDPRHVI